MVLEGGGVRRACSCIRPGDEQTKALSYLFNLVWHITPSFEESGRHTSELSGNVKFV